MKRLVLALSIATAAVSPAAAGDEADAQQVGGRSGFWSTPKPPGAGAYRWRLLYVGIGLAALSGGAMLLLVRRANAQRAARDAASPSSSPSRATR
ncbi:MAG: hypothetical protein JNL83_01715 [Myxococcales bacterium]|nr:hypothetical protein [Myxococcales bacterium]